MTQIINNKQDMVDQSLDGVAFIHKHRLERVAKTGIIKRRDLQSVRGKVALISGGGSGHEPAHFGYVGAGMLSASVSGPVFVPPSSAEIYQAIQLMKEASGVLLIIKNFEADVREFLLAEKKAKQDGFLIDHVIVDDDCSVEEGSLKKRRRGVAGTVFVHKILGAAAAEGKSLSELKEMGEEVIANMNTLGVALHSGKITGETKELFQLSEGQISFGIGIHGEAGYRVEPFYSSEYLANELVNKLAAQSDDIKAHDLAIMINGLGSTTAMEQFIFANDVQRLLQLEGIQVAFRKAGNFMTSTNMAGISLSFLILKDTSWLTYLEAGTDSFAW